MEIVHVVDNAGALVPARQGRGNRDVVQLRCGAAEVGPGKGWPLGDVGGGGRDPHGAGAEKG